MKTTIEIADDLFRKVQELARKEKRSFRSLTEEGLRFVLKQKKIPPQKLPPIVTFGGSGLKPEFEKWDWGKIRDEIYDGRGG